MLRLRHSSSSFGAESFDRLNFRVESVLRAAIRSRIRLIYWLNNGYLYEECSLIFRFNVCKLSENIHQSTFQERSKHEVRSIKTAFEKSPKMYTKHVNYCKLRLNITRIKVKIRLILRVFAKYLSSYIIANQ